MAELLKYATKNPENKSAEDIQAYADAVLKSLGAFDKHLPYQIDSKSLSRLIYEVHGIEFDLPYEILDQIFLEKTEKMDIMPGIKELLEYLKEQEIRLAILSNTGFCKESHLLQLEKKNINQYFEFFLPTTDYLLRKPDRRVFDLALRKLGLSSGEVWYVGNKFEYDVLGAFNADIFPVWINEEQEKPHSDIEHLMVSSHIELQDLLRKHWK